VIPAALLTVAVIAAAIVITNQQGTRHREPTYGPQVTLPVTGLNYPGAVAVDSADNLLVTDNGNNRVLELAAGSSTPTLLPFTGLNQPTGVAVDTGNLYVTDGRNNGRVLKLASGSSTQTVLPFPGLSIAAGVAVDSAGNLYVTDAQNNQVVKLAAGSTTPSVLPFTGLLDQPESVAVDAAIPRLPDSAGSASPAGDDPEIDDSAGPAWFRSASSDREVVPRPVDSIDSSQ
jgi:serine/threonine protein kinase, bacterial